MSAAQRDADSFEPHAPCPVPSEAAEARARTRLASLIKPPGSLGRLEDLVAVLAGLRDSSEVSAYNAAYVLFGADHGVTARGVSPYPSTVTTIMLEQIAAGRAASSVLARSAGARLHVVDVGAATDRVIDGVVCDKLRLGTRDLAEGPAMTEDEARFALAAGARAIARVAEAPLDIVVLGEMGIGNTTAAAAVLAALTGRLPAEVVGPGTGHAPEGVALKARTVATALEVNGLVPPADALRALAAVGGFEIAALSGAMIASARRRLPVLLDGFIAGVAALVAVRMCPTARPYLIAAHRSSEPGHIIALEALDARPLLDLSMRLGEGTGAAVALPLVRQACELYNGMATFEEAGIGR